MNLNIVKQEHGSIGTVLINEQERNVTRFKLHFVDNEKETDIPCVTVWYLHGETRTFTHIISVESF